MFWVIFFKLWSGRVGNFKNKENKKKSVSEIEKINLSKKIKI